MRRTIATIKNEGVYRVIYDDQSEYNPYVIYNEGYSYSSRGVWGYHRKMIGKYADLQSCLYKIADIIRD